VSDDPMSGNNEYIDDINKLPDTECDYTVYMFATL